MQYNPAPSKHLTPHCLSHLPLSLRPPVLEGKGQVSDNLVSSSQEMKRRRPQRQSGVPYRIVSERKRLLPGYDQKLCCKIFDAKVFILILSVSQWRSFSCLDAEQLSDR